MNVFTNSIINIIYSLFNSIMPENVKMLFVLVSALTYIFGMILSYFHYKQKFEHPLLYVIPVIRIFVILLRDVENKKQEFYQKACGTLLLVALLDLYFASMNEEIILNAFALGAVLLALAELFGAILNYHLLCEADEIKMRDRNSFDGIMLYIFPFLYLYFTLPDEYKSKSIKQKISALLAVIVFLESFITFSTVEVKAATLGTNIGCEVCDHSNSIIEYRIVISSCNTETNEDVYDSCYGYTCPECEIIHVIDTDEDFGYRTDSDGCDFWDDCERVFVFMDYSRIDSRFKEYSAYDVELLASGILLVEREYEGKFYCNVGKLYSEGLKLFIDGKERPVIGFTRVLPSNALVVSAIPVENLTFDLSQAVVYEPACIKNSSDRIDGNKYVVTSSDVDKDTIRDYTNLNGNNVNTNSNGEERISIGNVFKDIDWGKTAKDSLVKSIGAVGVGIGLAALASISTPIAIGIAAIGTVSSIVYGVSTVSRIMTVAKSDDMSIEAKEYAWAGLASDLMSDGVAIVAGSVAYSYSKPKFETSISTKYPNHYEMTSELVTHLSKGNYTKRNGVNGGHERTAFMKLAEENSLNILSEIPVENFNGVSVIRYENPKSKQAWTLTKTVYDQNVISVEDFIARGLEACNKSKVMFVEGSNSAIDAYGVEWEVIIRDGIIKTLYPVLNK